MEKESRTMISPPPTPPRTISPCEENHQFCTPPEIPSTPIDSESEVAHLPTEIAYLSTPPSTPPGPLEAIASVLKSASATPSCASTTKPSLSDTYWFDLPISCLQCELLDLRCDYKRPSCTRCLRRQQCRPQNAGCAGDVRPCLIQRGANDEEIEVWKEAQRWQYAPYFALVRLDRDDDAMWQRKLEVRDELVAKQQEKEFKMNWVFPRPEA